MDESTWNKEEWDTMCDKLNLLSLEQLTLIAEKAGLVFTGGIPPDRKDISTKEQIILALDEVSKDELLKIYNKIVL